MTESLKIAFYTDTFLPAVDGVVVSVINFRKELEKRGHEVYLFASGNEKTKQMVKGDSRITVIKGITFKKYPQYSMALFPLASAFKVRNVRMDINHAHTPFMMGVHALTISKFDRKPLVGSFHTLFTNSSVIKEYTVDSKIVRKTILKYSWKYAKFFYDNCNSTAAPSEAIKRMLIRKDIKNVDVIPNGTDLKSFNPKIDGSKVRTKLLKSGREKLVMYVGRLSREKSLETLINSARSFKDENVRFALVGTGPAYNYYQRMISRMNLQDKIKIRWLRGQQRAAKVLCRLRCLLHTFNI